jgi:CBS domain-containing protein
MNSDPKDILDAAIFFDFRCLYGDNSLVDSLRDHVNRTAGERSVFFYHMAQSVMKMKLPLNIFGSIRSDTREDEPQLDIKWILVPVTSFLRLYAIREELSVTGSMERNHQLLDKKIIDRTLYDKLEQSFNYLTYLRIKGQAMSIAQNDIPGNTINTKQLSKIEAATLKGLISDVASLQTKLGIDFGPPQG